MFVRYNVYSFIGLKCVLRTVNNVKVLYEVWKRASSYEIDVKYFRNGIHEPFYLNVGDTLIINIVPPSVLHRLIVRTIV